MHFLLIIVFSVLILVACLFVAQFGRKWNLRPFAAVGSGALLSICFLDFLPQSFVGDSHSVSLFILGGIVVQGLADIYLLPRLSFFDRWLKLDHSSVPEHSHTLSSGSICSLTGCLAICSFFDGIRLFSAFNIEGIVVFATAFGLFFHLLSEGVLLAVLAISSGVKKRVMLVLVFCTSGAFLLGTSLAQVFFHFSSEWLIAFSTGILIYICFVHLLPFSLKQKNKYWFFIGLLFWTSLHFLI